MRLCFIANANLAHTWRWIGSLKQRGHSIALISYTPIKHPVNGVQIIDLTRINNTPKIRFIIWAAWLRRYLHRTRPEILHVHQVQAAGWLGWLSGYHPLIISAWGSDLLKEPDKSPLRRWLVVRALSACDRLVVSSPILAQAALGLGIGAQQIVSIPWGVDTTVYSPVNDDRIKTRLDLGLQPDEEVIFCPRSLTPLYRIHDVIQAVSRVAEDRPRVRLMLVEYNPDQDYVLKLRQLASQSGLGERILWLPARQSDQEMASLYRAADIIVSVPASEGFGLSVFEALACGTPAIVSDLPVFAEALQHGVHAWKVPPGDVEALAQALLQLLPNTEQQAKLAKQGRNQTHHLSHHKMADKAEAMYAEVISAYAADRHAAL